MKRLTYYPDDDGLISDDNGQTVAQVYDPSIGAVMAAGPELLEAAKAALQRIEDFFPGPETWVANKLMLRKSIAKAEGKS